MEGLLAILALGVVAWIVIGPIIVLANQSRIRRLEQQHVDLLQAIAELRARLTMGPTSKTAAFSPTKTQVMEAPADQTQEVSIDDDAVANATGESPRLVAAESEFATVIDEDSPTRSPAGIGSEPPPLPGHTASAAAAEAAERAALSRYGFPARPPRAPSTKKIDALTLEEIFAGKWLTWVGALALIIGLGFFLKYMMDRGWLGPVERVGLGLAVAAGLFGGAVVGMRKQYRLMAEGLAGAALGIAYMTLYAAFAWYHLIDQPKAFAGMAVAAAATLGFAAYYNAQATAFLGLLGGFLTPMMLSTGKDAQVAFFSYILLLDLGVLILAGFRRWYTVQTLALVGTIFMWIAWFDPHYADEKFATTVGFLTAFWVLFVAISIWQLGLKRLLPAPADFLFLLATPTAFFVGLSAAFEKTHSGQTGRIAASLGVAYFLIAWLFQTWRAPLRSVVLALAGVGLTFVTIAVPLEFSRHWIPLAWSVESLVLVELGLRRRNQTLRRIGFCLLIFVQAILFVYAVGTLADPWEMRRYFDRAESAAQPPDVHLRPAAAVSWTTVFNGRTFSFLGAAFAAAILAWEYWRRRDEPAADGDEPISNDIAFGPLLVGVPWMLLAMFAAETANQGDLRKWFEPTYIGAFLTWTSLAALALVVIASRCASTAARRAGYFTFGVLGVLTVVSLLESLSRWRFLIRQPEFVGATWWYYPVINPRGVGLLVSAVATLSAALWLRRAVVAAKGLGELEDAADHVPLGRSKGGLAAPAALLGLLAYAIGLTFVTVEIYSQGVLRAWGTGTSLGVTSGWTLYAVAALLVGIACRNREVRLLALGTFVLATIKVFFYDIWYLNPTIRYIAFSALGVALMLTSYLYRRFRDRLPTAEDREPR